MIGVGLAGELDKVHNLFDQIQRTCDPLGFGREHRPYRPHVTLARVRKPLPARDRRALADAAANDLPSPEFTVREFVLMQSRLLPNGAHRPAGPLSAHVNLTKASRPSPARRGHFSGHVHDSSMPLKRRTNFFTFPLALSDTAFYHPNKH